MIGENKYSFSEKWEAQAFVIICHLNEIGFIDWPEWTELFKTFRAQKNKNRDTRRRHILFKLASRSEGNINKQGNSYVRGVNQKIAADTAE